MTTAVFPGGKQQIAEEARKVASLLDNRVSQDLAKNILVHAKGRALLAIQSANDPEEALQRCINSIHTRSQGQLDRAAAEKVAVFAFQSLTDQQHSGPTTNWPSMNKDEALEVARITAYRLARHQGRTDPVAQQSYDLDPLTYITASMSHYLARGKGQEPGKISTDREAIDLSLDVASTLAVAYYVEKHGTAAPPDPRDIARLAEQELNRTLELLRRKETVRRYSDYDPSEARAAHEMQVPFDVALTLGEVGLLKDHPGPSDTRQELIGAVVKQLRDS